LIKDCIRYLKFNFISKQNFLSLNSQYNITVSKKRFCENLKLKENIEIKEQEKEKSDIKKQEKEEIQAPHRKNRKKTNINKIIRNHKAKYFTNSPKKQPLKFTTGEIVTKVEKKAKTKKEKVEVAKEDILLSEREKDVLALPKVPPRLKEIIYKNPIEALKALRDFPTLPHDQTICLSLFLNYKQKKEVHCLEE